MPASCSAVTLAGLSGDERLAPLATAAEVVTGESLGGVFVEEAMSDFDEEELRDFLAADDTPVPVDTAFKERLRDQLWALVRQGVTTPPKPH